MAIFIAVIIGGIIGYAMGSDPTKHLTEKDKRIIAVSYLRVNNHFLIPRNQSYIDSIMEIDKF